MICIAKIEAFFAARLLEHIHKIKFGAGKSPRML
jgi:hypothetical protein